MLLALLHPTPTCRSVPATILAMLYRKPSPSRVMASPSPSHQRTSQRCSVRTVVLRPPLLWKDAKSRLPSSNAPARRIASTSTAPHPPSPPPALSSPTPPSPLPRASWQILRQAASTAAGSPSTRYTYRFHRHALVDEPLRASASDRQRMSGGKAVLMAPVRAVSAVDSGRTASNCATCPRAETPASVRPAGQNLTRCASTGRSRSSSTPSTVRSGPSASSCFCQPWKPPPS
mmetsp:Transcript_41070/g.129516  ORF Transcript_41070/g.129516 Transcript_41070/m.129516 type:complete len:232 (-) Transcript_41070:251-946(-)